MKNLYVILISLFCLFGVLQQHCYAASVVFNLPVVDGDPVAVQVTLDDTVTVGAVKVTAEITGAIIGEVNGVFFDLKQNVNTLPLLPSAITGNPGGIAATISEGAVNNIGNGVNMNGSGQSFFDVGVRIGTSGGIGRGDDFQMGMFTVAGVSLSDFTNIGVRVKSVDVDGSRTGSSKLSGPVPTGEIGDTVFCDLVDDGVQDPNEPGIEGVTVNLTCAGPDGQLDTLDDILASQNTDANGNYLFTGLEPGICRVEVDLSTGPADKEPGDCPTTFTIDLQPGQSFLDADFCFRNKTGEIGDFVWCDLNDDGIQDADEPGIEGVTVNLTCTATDGTVFTDTQTTDADGMYLFTGVPAGSCEVDVDESTAPVDKEPGTNCPQLVSVQLQPGDSFLDADFCFKFIPGVIGDTVFCDRNNNGVQDADDPGIAGVTVNIVCTLPDGSMLNDSQVTDLNGKYLFTGLPAGSTCEVTVDPTTVVDKEPGDNCPDTFIVDVIANQSFLDADFCFKNILSEIGDFVWCDLNDDGVQDAGEPGIEGVVVTLTCDGSFIGLQVTDADGKYLFTDVPAGNCEVVVDPSTAPTDKVPGNNCPTTITVDLQPGQSFLDADFCFILQPCEHAKPITALFLRWDGLSSVNIVSEGGQVINGINNGEEITLDTAGLGNDVDITISGAVNGESRFHVSCSDQEMNGPDDCGSNQGNGKGNDASFINDWIFEGLVGDVTLDCTP